MAANKIVIGEDAQSYTIETAGKFNIGVQPKINDNGTVDSAEWTIEGQGDLVADDPGAVADLLVLLTNEVSAKFNPRRVRIYIDGVVKFDLKPQDAIVGPFVTLAKSDEADGNAASRWRYSFQISTKVAGGSNQADKVTDLSTSIEVTVTNGQTVRKIWKATAKGKTITDALNKVKSFKPTETDVVEQIERFFQESRVTAAWVWDARKKDKILRVKEKVRIKGGGREYVYDLQAGKDTPPVVFLARKAPIEIEITGSIYSYDKAVKKPELHFAESDTMIHATYREIDFAVEIEDDIRGIYRLDYTEYWISTKDDFPAPNHHDHDKIAYEDPPADGKAAS